MATDGRKGKNNSCTSSSPQQVVAAPFMTKTYEMVSDARTDTLIHWGTMNNTFIVPDPSIFSNLLLPSYFKHGNFSSFVRQLNTYGFRKIDPDRWEFAHESFLRGQAHLLPVIVRRRVRKDEISHDKAKQKEEEEEEEEEWLLEEVGRLRSQQRVLEDEMQVMNRRLEATERRPQQMMAFITRVAEEPGFLPRLVNSKIEGDKRRRLLLVPPPAPPPLQYFEMGATPIFPMGSYDDGPAIATGSDIVWPEFGVTGSSSTAAAAATFPFSLLGEGFF